MTEALARLPSVDSLLAHPRSQTLVALFGHALTVDAFREALDDARREIRAGGDAPVADVLADAAGKKLSEWTTPRPHAVINATGVIIHTNLGRAPLSVKANEAMWDVSQSYSDLEYDLESGERGHRMAAVGDLLCRVTGAEAALVVNNNAGAVLLALIAHGSGREVVISRGQLVEIGGGFRIPEVLMQSGAKLVEVGTTNRTHRRDYEAAAMAALLLAVLLVIGAWWRFRSLRGALIGVCVVSPVYVYLVDVFGRRRRDVADWVWFHRFDQIRRVAYWIVGAVAAAVIGDWAIKVFGH